MPNYTLGLDLGQAADYSALAIVERLTRETGKMEWVYPMGYSFAPAQLVPAYESLYHLIHLERFELGTGYPAIVDRVCELMERPPLKGQAELVVDATGVGRPVVDMFDARQPGGRYPVPVIHPRR